jgi:hypothetical protein
MEVDPTGEWSTEEVVARVEARMGGATARHAT